MASTTRWVRLLPLQLLLMLIIVSAEPPGERGQCSGHTCRMLCAYGFATDEQGCPLCRCYDPCSEITCSGSLTCQLEDAPCSRPPCLPVPTCKKGRSLENVCGTGAPLTMPGSGNPPRPFLCGKAPGQPRCPPLFDCSVQPGNDYGVCCPSAARVEKPGVCPARGEWPDLENCGPSCQFDQQCSGPLKCCHSSECGLSCTPPTNLTECRQLRQLSVDLAVSEREGRGYIPQCDPVTGAFRPRQCSRNGRVCWCVDAAGNKIPGSMGAGSKARCAPNAIRGRSLEGSPCMPAARCAQICEFGFRLDESGCQTCECDDPCAGAVCGEHEVCVALRDPDCEDGPLCASTPICKPKENRPRTTEAPATSSTERLASHELQDEPEVDDVRSESAEVSEEQDPTERSAKLGESDDRRDGDDSVGQDEEPRQASMCEYLRDFRDKMEGTRAGMSLALPPPSCKSDGAFNDTQCHGGACWCVDSFGTEIPQTRSTGSVPNCVKVRESLDCLDLTCRLGCEFGFTLAPDTRCPLCECRDPCAEAECSAGHECHVVDVACDAEYCPPVPACLPKKPGQCPYLVPVSSGTCDYQCRSDYNCNETAKCCSNGCGTQCVQPVVMTECQHRRAILQHESHEAGIPASKLWMPRCREQDGAYESVQCHSGTNQCWCVDSHGQELPGTRVENNAQPDCRVNSKCPVLDCPSNCPYGQQLDQRGCLTCSCRDPCAGKVCLAEGQSCRVVQVECADPPCHGVAMCLPHRENPCESGKPLEESGVPVRCGPDGSSCPSSHKCELSPLGEYAFCCPKPRDVCFESPLIGPCDSPSPRWYFNPERNTCQQLGPNQCGQQHNNFHSMEACGQVCPVLSQCERLREKNQKAADKYKKWTFLPRCSPETGAWLPLQCLTQVGVCWCVSPDGQPLKGTLTRDLNASCPAPDIVKPSNRQARRRHDFQDDRQTWDDPEKAIMEMLRGLGDLPHIPELFQNLAENSRRSENSAPSIEVPLNVLARHRTRCLALRSRSQDQSTLECDHHGGFASTQCTPQDAPDAECWCVDEAGNQLPNTTTFRRGHKICLPTPIEAVDVRLGFLGQPGVVDSAAEKRVLEVVRTALASIAASLRAASSPANTRHEDLRVEIRPGIAVASFSLEGPGKVDTAFHLEELVKTGTFGIAQESGTSMIADITNSRFTHRTSETDISSPRVIALKHREIVSESPEIDVARYHTAVLVLSAASAFIIVILGVLVALYRRRMIAAAVEKHQIADDDRFGGCEPIYVVRLPSGPPDMPKLDCRMNTLNQEDA